MMKKMANAPKSVFPVPIVIGWRQAGLALVVLASIWSLVARASADERASAPGPLLLPRDEKGSPTALLEPAHRATDMNPIEALSQWVRDRPSNPAQIVRSLDELERDSAALTKFQRSSLQFMRTFAGSIMMRSDGIALMADDRTFDDGD